MVKNVLLFCHKLYSNWKSLWLPFEKRTIFSCLFCVKLLFRFRCIKYMYWCSTFKKTFILLFGEHINKFGSMFNGHVRILNSHLHYLDCFKHLTRQPYMSGKEKFVFPPEKCLNYNNSLI